MDAGSTPRTIARLATASLAIVLVLAAGARADVRLPARSGLGVRVASLPGNAVPGPSKKTGTYTARILIGTAVKDDPGRGRTVWYASGTSKWSGTEQRLMVLESRSVHGRTWLKVRLPIRPNRSSGWIPRDRVELERTRRYVHVDLSRRLLRVYAKGRVIARFKVVVGAPSTPTPRGLFAIYDKVKQADPHGFTGQWVLPLTAYSRKLHKFDGGPGVVGLHGRGGTSFLDPLGSARSHGCIRMNNSRIRYLSKLIKGTAVQVRG